MSSYAPNTAVPLLFQALDPGGAALTGLTGANAITVKVFRADGQVWDWTTSAFSATPSDPTETLAEVSASNAPGYYYVSWPGSVVGDYFAEFTPPAGQTISDKPVAQEILVRDYATGTTAANIGATIWGTAETGAAGTFGHALTLLRKHLTNQQYVDTTGGGRMRLFDDDGNTVILTWTLSDRDGNAIATPAGSPVRRSEAT